MDVLKRSLGFLDWPVLVEHLAGLAGSRAGRLACLNVPLAETLVDARAAMSLTTEMLSLIDEASMPGMSFPEIEKLLAAAEKGAVLSPEELGDVASVAEVATACRRFYLEMESKAPGLAALAADLTPMPALASKIRTSFDGEGRIRDSVSSELARLRKDRERLSTEIREEMERLKRDESWSKVLQDDYVTIRGDRFVLPVKIGAKSMELGIVHDTSRSGETIFVEPTQLVDRNNKLKITEVQLQRESRRILAELAGDVAEQAGALRRNVAGCTRIDVVRAKAKLSLQLDAAPVEITDDRSLHLPELRHPLLILKGTVEVIGNDLHLGQADRALIITGPNAGGKTVLLKSAALAALMTRAGMHVPTAEGATVGFFDPVLADIGDQQTVLGDLSTFSAHLQNLAAILEKVRESGKRPLILLDELFVGTNPDQGAGLARATLEYLVERTEGLILVTTHYDALKALAASDDRFHNAAMEFDATRLQPTFRLADGMPGRSYAYDIAERFGLPEELLAEARELTADASRGLEEVIAQLEARESEMEEQTRALRNARQQLEDKTAVLEVERRKLAERERALAEERLAEAGELIEQAREEIRKLVADAQKAGTSKAAETARRRVEERADKLEKALTPAEEPTDNPPSDVTVEVGAEVFVPTVGRDGTVTAVNDKGTSEVAVGSFTIEVPTRELRAPRKRKPSRKPRRKAPEPPAPRRTLPENGGEPAHAFPTPANSCDLRGLRVDEALTEVERYLDQALLDGRTPVFLIHGHGTGALKSSVRELLASSAYVNRWRPGEQDQGGDGVTVVDLA